MFELSLPEVLDSRYHLIKELQHREGCQTLLATQIATQKPVVIKRFTLSSGSGWDELESFEREVKTLKHLDHPRIPKLIETFRTQEPLGIYVIQEAVEGHSRRAKFKQKGPVTEEQAKAWAKKTLHILDYLHRLHPPVIHRDIKPDNLLIDKQGQIHLIDFGAVRDSTHNNMTIVGTFGYMPPEQAAGQAIAATDLYALGVTLIECLSGKPPHLLGRNRRLQIFFHEYVSISAQFQRWLDALTDPDPLLRTPNARQALEWLDAEALPESLGRLQLNYPEPGLQVLTISPNPEKPHLWQAAKRTLFRSLLPVFPLTFAGLIIWRISVGNEPPFPSSSTFLFIVVLSLLLPWLMNGWLEWKALLSNAQEEFVFKIYSGKVAFKNTETLLSKLNAIHFGSAQSLKLGAATRLFFDFGTGHSFSIPVELELEEQQWLTHIFEKAALSKKRGP